MKKLSTIPLSVLDSTPVNKDSTPAESLRNTLSLAQHVEKLGFHRYWLAEHHNMPGIASAATSVVIGHVAGGTQKIRVGAGGIMLLNHAPLIIAEQFGTLESLYPGRIDLGLGRASGGGNKVTTNVLRRTSSNVVEDFPELLEELRYFLREPVENQEVMAVPGGGLHIPIWLLGSSVSSAQFAGKLGLPFAYAAHFSPKYLLFALQVYRQTFQSSGVIEKPYVMVAINVFAAETNEAAERLATSQQQSFLQVVRGTPSKLYPPVDSMDEIWTETEKTQVEARLGASIIGDAETVKAKLDKLLDETNADELIIHTVIYDHAARLRSYEIIADIWKSQSKENSASTTS